MIKRFVHPFLGTLTLDCQILTAENLTERLVVFTASPGSEDARRLTLLSAIGVPGSPNGWQSNSLQSNSRPGHSTLQHVM